MKIVIEIKTENAAFEDPIYEINRILDVAKKKIEQNNFPSPLSDINGNKVGKIYLTK